MANFKDIDKARILLHLGEEASLSQIKDAYRKLVRRYYPDTSRKEDKQETMKEINWAYELLEDYCSRYKYSFTEKMW